MADEKPRVVRGVNAAFRIVWGLILIAVCLVVLYLIGVAVFG